MDILSHGLWAGAVAKIANKKLKKPISVWRTAWWGIFPDLAAFILPTFLAIYGLILGKYPASEFLYRAGVDAPWYSNDEFLFNLIHQIYSFSHSFFVFGAVFLVAYVILKRPVWEMSGWLLHILIDIPTHTALYAELFPTTTLWPFSHWTFNGIGWAHLWFLIPNYAAIIIVYILLHFIKKNKKKV
jgi:hypothetical protein